MIEPEIQLNEEDMIEIDNELGEEDNTKQYKVGQLDKLLFSVIPPDYGAVDQNLKIRTAQVGVWLDEEDGDYD